GSDAAGALVAARAAVDEVRSGRRPAVLHLRTVRFGGHAGSDAEIAYRSTREIEADYQRDPLLSTAQLMLDRGVFSAVELQLRSAGVASRIVRAAETITPARRLATAAEVAAPLSRRDPGGVAGAATEGGAPARREEAFRGRLPEDSGGLTLAQAINATLIDLMV